MKLAGKRVLVTGGTRGIGRATVTQLDDLQLIDRDGSKVTKNEVDDHHLSWSLYFLDPDGNRFELTSYEYEEIRVGLNKPGQS